MATSPGFSISIVASQQYTFTNAGAVAKGSYSVAEGASVSAISTTPDNRGTYTVQGHRLLINYENGTQEERVIMFDPRTPRFMFLDGVMYSKP